MKREARHALAPLLIAGSESLATGVYRLGSGQLFVQYLQGLRPLKLQTDFREQVAARLESLPAQL